MKYSSKQWLRGLLVLILTTAVLLLVMVLPFLVPEPATAARVSLVGGSFTHPFTATATISMTQTATPTLTVTPTVTLTMTPPLTVTITPTATPVLTNGAFLPAILQPAPTETPSPSPTPSPTTEAVCLPNPPLEPSDEAIDAAVLTSINEQRALNGLNPYPSQAQLVQAARRHVHDMADNDVFTHTGSDGSTAAQRIEQACYEAAWTSEIIGWGFPTVEAMMAWWLDSTTHRQTILNVSLEEVGVAYLRQPDSSFTHYWTITFAKAASSTADVPFYHCETRLVEPGRGLSVQWWQDEPCPASEETP